jgi:4-amino-4-deoxy-L-arabinose transferase-like glycosyltransferase
MGWVILSIYLLAKWAEQNNTRDFFLAIMAIAGGMMTKGPIAIVVPVLCFVPQWVSQQKWSFFIKPIYLLGLLLLAILLVPMSWGLYQQYDLHPGKLINNRPIESGLKFYYWTQSFGRYTGENFYHEMSYFTFLLENMFWSFLPWIFVFLWALVSKAFDIVKEGVFKPRAERISFFGFVLTYLVLSRSQAQLPHYIFVVFPLAAILTAAHWEKTIWHQTSISKGLRFFYGFHLFLFTILLIILAAVIFIPFGWAGWIATLLGVVVLVLVIRTICSKQLVGQKWFYAAVIIMLGINSIMNSHFYPHLLQYQWGNQLAKQINEKGWDKNKIVTYKIPNSNAFHFYGQHVFPAIQDSLQLKEGDWVVTDTKNNIDLKIQFPKSQIQYQGERFHVTMLTLPFLNPATRKGELTEFNLIQLLK